MAGLEEDLIVALELRHADARSVATVVVSQDDVPDPRSLQCLSHLLQEDHEVLLICGWPEVEHRVLQQRTDRAEYGL